MAFFLATVNLTSMLDALASASYVYVLPAIALRCTLHFQQEGRGRVLVVDGNRSLRCAFFGDKLAQMTIDTGWSGIIIKGCIRDSEIIATMAIGIEDIAISLVEFASKGEG